VVPHPTQRDAKELNGFLVFYPLVVVFTVLLPLAGIIYLIHDHESPLASSSFIAQHRL
jgi:hypothetical protein